jgi:6,7-dimethyl-8-ribityllumazine synthase
LVRASQKRSQEAAPVARADLGIACIVSRYHEEVTGAMRDSALRTLAEGGVPAANVRVIEAPGTFELPILAQAAAPWFDAVLCFGLVLKGETEHDRHIAAACAQGLMRVALDAEVPVLFGVLTCATLEQAQRRSRSEAEGGLDKGREVALAALATLDALEALS